MEWIIANKEWLFSGIGVLAISTVVGCFVYNKKNKQTQKSGDNSVNIQAGDSININAGNGTDE